MYTGGEKEVLTAGLKKIKVFLDAAPCRLASSKRRFGRSYCLYLPGLLERKSKALRPFETWVNVRQTTRRCISEGI